MQWLRACLCGLWSGRARGRGWGLLRLPAERYCVRVSETARLTARIWLTAGRTARCQAKWDILTLGGRGGAGAASTRCYHPKALEPQSSRCPSRQSLIWLWVESSAP